ncbi:hypothetical protein DYB28_003632 [Aphanomyces astaci]|uniref:Uncharacterized protein n=1 Tax=Aphanomyces astaci TaxID=112090 RepID=A0A397DM37_APHAT|nr:hypothetical protein DYB36_002115 [Aphanomyces astaci]RHY54594.1 hypothetical protein DYB38_005094 [Aphanomyces astaci]RHY63993.1 hypothetical protein DYB30_000780 [Aphanomyces astaci]RLO09532.1 hypothetical protein DYB28_003632 [Aphanomyces astaci]
MDNDDDGDDTLADTVAGTDAGSQNTPSQWKKHFAEQVPPLQVASPPRALPLCTYDEDETQILFCSNYSITLRFHVMAMLMCCHDVDQMQLAEVELPLVPHENYVGDGDSSNESEDLWTIGDSTLDQPHPTFDGPVDGAIPNAASTTEASQTTSPTSHPHHAGAAAKSKRVRRQLWVGRGPANRDELLH